ncbi:hypothetical protein ARMGADRAFT_591549 [Armillaria gallica]|uniref:Uncharacterized protein n=1 Tax=Armillaria gallica TaxID=47427 RepID=A0A2H3CTB1_ARMGA|nr:hypothetical protein ARMGADRAFT_591549 [Armillaria gallica]
MNGMVCLRRERAWDVAPFLLHPQAQACSSWTVKKLERLVDLLPRMFIDLDAYVRIQLDSQRHKNQGCKREGGMCLFDVTVRFPFNHSHPTTSPYIFRLSASYSTADDVLTRETAHLNPKSETVAINELFEAFETVSRKQSWCSTATTPASPKEAVNARCNLHHKIFFSLRASYSTFNFQKHSIMTQSLFASKLFGRLLFDF